MPSEFELKKITTFLESDGEDAKQQLILSGLFIMVFEQFKKFIINTVDDFFCRFENKDGTIITKRGTEFKEIIKEFGQGKKGQHKNKDFRGALHFFYNLQTISSEELNKIECLYLLRNNVGHELFDILLGECKPTLKIENITTTLSLYSRLHKWYIKEIEVNINENLNKEKGNINFEEFWLLEIGFLEMIISKILLTYDLFFELTVLRLLGERRYHCSIDGVVHPVERKEIATKRLDSHATGYKPELLPFLILLSC